MTTATRHLKRLSDLGIGAVVLAAIASILSFLPFDAWLIDLTRHFRLQYTVFFACAAVLLVLRWRWAVTALLLLGLNMIELVPRWFAVPTPDPGSGVALRVMTFNVNTRGEPGKALQVIAKAQPDIVLLLEVDQHWLQQLAGLRQSLPFQVAYPRPDNFGIALFSRFAMQSRVVSLGPAQLPSIHASIDIHGHPLQFWGTHPPPPISPTMSTWRDDQLTALTRQLQGIPLTILAGDFNTTPYTPKFARLLRNAAMQDAGVGFGVQGTWPWGFNLLSIPIDHVLHTQDMATTRSKVMWHTGSDHGALVVDLRLPGITTGR
ncbi:MAG: endonuclease/exonuclease/phosphatase family protein [Pseudomonadota bacterium]